MQSPKGEYTINTVYTDTSSEDIESSPLISGKQDKQTIMDSYDTFMDIINVMIVALAVAANDLESSDRCIVRLVERLKECDEFPHEIGLFLGYPPEDVQGFIDNKAKGFKSVGMWKVYGDVVKAERTFQKYKKCTSVYCTQYANGRSIERLTVAE